MADPQFVVVELRVDASNAQSGAAQYTAALDKAGQAADGMALSASKAQLAITNQSTAMTQAAAANDNLAKGYRAANDNFNDFGKSLADKAGEFLTNVNHLKLMALAAYSMSPAFRSFANTEIAQGLQLVGVNLNVVSMAFRGLTTVVGPALSFFSRIAIPIGAVVGAWMLLNDVIKLGSGLLDKYGNAQRELFGEGVDDNIKKLTKFQQDTISPAQVATATSLGARLKEAKQTISDFFAVSLDLTDPALKLQSAWVTIVEAMAKAVGFLGNIGGKTDDAMKAIGNSSIWNKLNWGFRLPGALTPEEFEKRNNPPVEGQGTDYAHKPLMGRPMGLDQLSAAMGGLFPGRFKNAINDLANPPKQPDAPKAETSNGYDRALQSVKDQIDLLQLEATGAGQTTKAYQELKIAHQLNIAAMKAGIEPTEAQRAEWKNLADQIADYTIKARAAKALQDEQFKGATMFMSPGEAAAANVAHQIDPNDWQSHMHDLAAETARFNQQLGQSRDLAVGFMQSFNNDIVNGTVSMNTLTNAVKGLESKMLDMAENQLINGLFSGATKSGSGGIFSGIGALFGLKDGGSFVVPGGAGAMALPGFADGTDFTVGGSGAPDSKVTAFRVSPGERVTVTPPGRGSGGATTVYSPTMNVSVNGDGVTEDQVRRVVAPLLSAQYRQIKADSPKWASDQRSKVG